MSEVAGWQSTAKCAGRFFSRKSVFLALLGITIILFNFRPEPKFLYTSRKKLGPSQVVLTQPWESTELGSQSDSVTRNEVKEDPLRWRIRNHTRTLGRAGWESDYIGWHPRRIDSAEFIEVKALQPGRLELVRHPHFGETPVLVKIANAHEATIYRLLYDLGVTPSFLGHVTQSGRTVGFMTEFVQIKDGESPLLGTSRRREACLAALRQMHARGIAHRDAHGENCLLRYDGSAVLIDFELSAETFSQAEFDRDLWIMYHTILD